jgi:D-3-phosphoglycerate dehydrogenase
MSRIAVAVIGDRFMRPDFFVAALERLDPSRFAIRTLELPWPDEPMVHGYRDGGLAGLKEYMGDPAEIAQFLGGAAILVTHLAPVSAAMLGGLPDLKLIAVSRGGPVNIDLGAARARGIPVVNAPGRNASAVAEFTIGAILAETRLITRGHVSMSRGMWRGDLYRADTTGDELCAMTVGLIGYGHIGTRVVRLLKPFGCRILVTDPYVRLDPADAADGVEQVDLDTLLHRCDIVSLHARVTAETTGLIGAREFGLMKDGVYFINTARGPLVDHDALYRALTGGKVRGAMLETFAIEPPPPGWPLLTLDNVTLTPHIAGASLTTVRRAAAMMAEEIRRYLGGEPFLNPA